MTSELQKVKTYPNGMGYEICSDTIYIGLMRVDGMKVDSIICTIDWDDTYKEVYKNQRLKNAEKICLNWNTRSTDLLVDEMAWADKEDAHTPEIRAALAAPCDHELYVQAFEMVSNRHSKFALVHLVYWLLTKHQARKESE